MPGIKNLHTPLLLAAGGLLGYAFACGAVTVKDQARAAPPTGSLPRASAQADSSTGQTAEPLLLALQKAKAPPKEEGAPREAVSPSGWIGIMLEAKKGEGLQVVSVFPGGPAAFAGIRAGDILEKIGEKAPNSLEAAVEAIERLTPNQPASISIRRDGKSLDLNVTPGNLMDFHGDYAQEMLRRDPRDPNFGLHHGVTGGDISVELVRRIFEQNQRLDAGLQQVLEELHALRKEIRASKK